MATGCVNHSGFDGRLLQAGAENQAYLAARRGEAYVLHFTDGGSVKLDLGRDQSRFELEGMDVGSGEWGDQGALQVGRAAKMAAPEARGWVAVITRR